QGQGAEQPWRTLQRRVEEAGASEEGLAYLQALRNAAASGDLLGGQLTLEWAPVRLLSDDPAKGLGRAPPEGLLTPELFETLGAAASRLDLVSAYFVPGEEG